jgi:hypothetical protein
VQEHYCQIIRPGVPCRYVDFPPEERAVLHLLYMLYACVFWRGEAELLRFQSSLKSFSSHRQI